MTWQHWLADSWANHDVTRGMFWANGMVPRGPIMGCHVAPRYWLVGLVYKNFMGVRGVRPPDLPTVQSLHKSPDQWATFVSCYVYGFLIYYLKLHFCILGGVGPGLSPDPWSFAIVYI
jgi:hypothetical protein